LNGTVADPDLTIGASATAARTVTVDESNDGSPALPFHLRVACRAPERRRAAGVACATRRNPTHDSSLRRGTSAAAMSALPQTFDVTAGAAVTRPAWVDRLERAGRVAAMCLLVVLVPGEAYRCSSGARIPRP
jgi:hypothetical protein